MQATSTNDAFRTRANFALADNAMLAVDIRNEIPLAQPGLMSHPMAHLNAYMYVPDQRSTPGLIMDFIGPHEIYQYPPQGNLTLGFTGGDHFNVNARQMPYHLPSTVSPTYDPRP